MMDFAESGPGEKKRLDYKLKQSLYDRISSSSPLGQYLSTEEDTYQTLYDKPLKGRQALFLVYEFFSVGKEHEKILSFHDLCAVRWMATRTWRISCSSGSTLSTLSVALLTINSSARSSQKN